MSDVPTPSPQQPVAASLPANSVAVLDQQGAFTRPWYAFFQALFSRTGGSGGSSQIINQILAMIAVINGEIATVQTDVATALSDAATALDEADLAQDVALIGIANAERQTSRLGNFEAIVLSMLSGSESHARRLGNFEALVLAMLSGLNRVGGAGSALKVLWNSTVTTLSAKSLNFVGGGVMVADDGHGNETITISGGGFMPLVTGDIPAQFVVTPDGECIAVPISG